MPIELGEVVQLCMALVQRAEQAEAQVRTLTAQVAMLEAQLRTYVEEEAGAPLSD
jgi:hypothetical protein